MLAQLECAGAAGGDVCERELLEGLLVKRVEVVLVSATWRDSN